MTHPSRLGSLSNSLVVVGLLGVLGSVACTSESADDAAFAESAIAAPMPVAEAPAPPPGGALPAIAPAPAPVDICPGGKVIDANQPPYAGALTADERRPCVIEALKAAAVNEAKDQACMAACLLSGPLVPACEAACGISGVAEGILSTAEYYYCIQEQYAKRPVKLMCLYPAQNGNPNVASVGCTQQAGGFGDAFDPNLAQAACTGVIGKWDSLYSRWYDTRNWTCAEILAAPGQNQAATDRCNTWIQQCVANTRAQCVPVVPPVPAVPAAP